MLSRISICLVAGVGLAAAFAGAGRADDRALDGRRPAVDGQAVERAFRSLNGRGAADGGAACAAALAPADPTSSPFGTALITHFFACEPAVRDDGEGRERFAALFAAMSRTSRVADADQAPLARFFARYGLPEAIVALGVAERLPEPSGVEGQELAHAVTASGEPALPARPDLADAGIHVPLVADVAAGGGGSFAVEALQAEVLAVEAPADAGATVEAIRDLLAPALASPLAVTAFEARAPEPPSPPQTLSVQPPRRSKVRILPRSDRQAIAAARRAAVAAAIARRRAARTVSVSRTVRAPVARIATGRGPRLFARPRTQVAPPAALSAPRPQARSFSPKMSSAGPAQPAAR